jgi:F-type H+-transporting ATPase subunit alpha
MDKKTADDNIIEVTSARKLKPSTVKEIQKTFGKDKEIVQIIDESIIGGIIVRNEGKLYSVSLKSKIEDLRDSLEEAAKKGGNDVVEPLKKEISEFESKTQIEEVGEVVSVKDGIALIDGLRNCQAQEMLLFPHGIRGLALNLEEETIGAIILGDFQKIKQGDIVKRTKEIMSIQVGEEMIGRVINPLGEAIDEGPEVELDKKLPIERIAPGVMARESVNQPLQTGIKAIDALIPIGKGQRELILGDRQTGKTSIAIDTILNQKGEDVICVYVAIGQKESKVARTVSILEERGAMEYTTVVSASASEPAPMLYLAPYAGVTLAEYFAEKGKDVLIVYDDLTKQAVAYREMSLLLRRPPGREAFPGDVFYLHSRLLERAVNLNDENGGGSITALPIIETQGGDNSAYIPTNVISITDGQIYLESNLFYKGVRPAVNVGASVSRVGGAAQIKPMKKVAGTIKLALAQYRDLEAFSQFSSDLDPETKKQLEKGKRITEILKQPQYQPLSVEKQIIVIYAINNGYLDHVEVEDLQEAEKDLIDHFRTFHMELLDKLKQGDWSDEVQEEMKNACIGFKEDQQN